MLHSIHLVFVALGCILFIGNSQAQLPYGQVDVPVSEIIAEDVVNFGLNLMQKMGTEYRKTLIISPLSISTALAMLLLGAKGKSFTELSSIFGIKEKVKLHEQLGLMLRDAQQESKEATSSIRNEVKWLGDSLSMSMRPYPTNSIGKQVVNIASGLFMQDSYSINLDYRQALSQIYNADIFPLDFVNDPGTAVDVINAWVKQKTMRKIKKIVTLGTVDRSTRMVLTNTVYFKARWEIDFIGRHTKNKNFYPNGKDTQPVLTVPMMEGLGAYPYYEDNNLKCHIFGIPYHGKMSTLYVIKPFDSSVERVASLQKNLNAFVINELISKMSRVSAGIFFPKMHITGDDNLRGYLKEMGISSIFDDSQYDLSLITSGNSSEQLYQSDAIGNLRNLEAQRQEAESQANKRADIYVSEIIHKVDFNVDEKGTEAAAATTAIMFKSGPQVKFVVDTPFILLVWNEVTKLPLFYGVINEPPTAKNP